MPAANPIPLDSASHVPLYVQLRDRLRGMIDDGRLRAGDRLSPTRNLAVELGVHRATVEAAYAELESEGLLVGQVGRGTFVAGRPKPAARPAPSPDSGAFFWSGYFSDNDQEDSHESLMRAAAEPGTISFAAAHPPAGVVPVREFERACQRALRHYGSSILRPGPTTGFPPLQEMLAARLGVKPAEIVITNGCQQSLDLLAKAFLAPGQSVVIENPVYPGALAPFRQAGARTLALPMTAEGPDIAALETILETHRVRLILVTPNFQNPTGASMTMESRRRLLELSRRFQIPVAENDSYGSLGFTAKSPGFTAKTPPALRTLDQSGGVIHLGSFSKCGFPGLRLGWCVASPAPLARLRRAKQATDLHTDPFVQAVMVEFAEKGGIDRTIEAVRKVCQANAETLAAEVAKHFPDDVVWRPPQGGLSAWFRLPAGVSGDAVLARAREHRVIFTPGRFFYFQESQPQTFRLSFGSVTRAEIVRGVAVLAAAIRAEMKLAASRARRPARASGGWSLV